MLIIMDFCKTLHWAKNNKPHTAAEALVKGQTKDAFSGELERFAK